MLDNNLEALASKAQALADFEAKEVAEARAITEIDAQIADITKRIETGGGSLESQEAQVKSCKTKLDTILNKFDKETQKKLFQYFEMENNPSLVAGIQGFVALLRNNKTGNNVDVELYLKDFDKLMFKLKRADVTSLSLTTVQHHQKMLQQVAAAFTTSSHHDYGVCCEYASYIAWAQAFVEYAQHAIVLNQEKQGNDVLGETKEKLTEKRAALVECQKLIEDEGVKNFFINQELTLRSRIDDYEFIADEDLNQAKGYQETYAKFEQKYFSGLNDVIAALKESYAGEAGVDMDD
jgi:hypothetical protein